MSLVSKLMVAALATLSAVACSSTPRQTAAPAAAAASPAPVAATNAPAAKDASDATSLAGAVAAQANARLVGQGYKAVKVKDQYVYCRMEAVTGTQFKKRVCLTESAIRDLEEQTQQTQDAMTKQRTGPSCFPGVNC